VDRGNGDLELLSVTAKDGIVARDSLERKDTSTEDKGNYKRVVPGDIAYNTMRMWQGVSAIVVREGIVSPAYTVVTPKKCISAEYAARLFKTTHVINEFLRHSQGLVDDTLNLKFRHFSEVTVLVPEAAEQKRIVELLEQSDREIKLLSQLRVAIEKQKRGIMERLLSGEVVIPDTVVDRLNAEAKEKERQRVKDGKRAKSGNKNAS
jgi:type I restriction enzyme S subunit